MATTLLPKKNKKRYVTYYVDTGTVYTANLKEGADCLSGLSFTPTLSGWTFLGWREDTTASGTVLSSKTVEKSSITLYAVFYQTITLAYSANGGSGSVSSQTGTRYYNNGNYSNPSFTLAANTYSYSGYAFTAWALGSSSGTQYAAGASVTLSASNTFYAVWISTVTPYYVDIVNTDWTETYRGDGGEGAYGETSLQGSYGAYYLENSSIRIEAYKYSSANGAYVQETLSASLETKGCSKCRVHVSESLGDSNWINSSTKATEGEAAYYEFDCSGDTFTLTLTVNDPLPYDEEDGSQEIKNSMTVDEIYFCEG